MTKKKQASMIGHDPLAWINETPAPDEPATEKAEEKAEEKASVKEPEQAAMAAEDKTVDVEVTQEAQAPEAQPHETIADVLDASMGTSVGAQDMAAAGIVKLEGDLTIQSVQGLHDMLYQALEQTGDIQLDAADVGRVDTAAMQTIYAFAKQANDGDRTFSWVNGEENIKAVAETLGMADVLRV